MGVKSKIKKHGGDQPLNTTRFQKGRSGNPNGRPKKDKKMFSVLEKEFNSPIQIKENGIVKTITKGEAFAKRLINDSLEGKSRVAPALLKLLEATSKKETDKTPPDRETVLEEDRQILERHYARFTPPEKKA